MSLPVEDAVALENVAPARRTGGVLALVFGGFAAGAIGFGATMLLRDAPAPAPAPVVVDTSAADQQLGDMADQISALRSQVSALKLALAEGPNQAVVDGLGKRLDRLDRMSVAQADIAAALGGRLSEIENRPAVETVAAADGGDAQALAAELRREVAALRQAVADAPGQVVINGLGKRLDRADRAVAALEARLGEIENAPQAALADTAVQRAFVAVAAAVNSGAAFTASVDDLTDAGVEVPPALVGAAIDGVVTLAMLQAQFPDAARAALTAAGRVPADPGLGSRLGAFLRVQLGARSLEPRDGSDADAVLSRTEAALRRGDVAGSVAEIGGLDAPAAQAMSNWVELAQGRLRIEDALAALSAQVGN